MFWKLFNDFLSDLGQNHNHTVIYTVALNTKSVMGLMKSRLFFYTETTSTETIQNKFCYSKQSHLPFHFLLFSW